MPQVFVRVDAWSLNPSDPIFEWYAKAVAAMQQKADTDPTCWTYQAAIHGTEASNPLPSWNQCKHGSWWFVSWHRMFVYYFERIVRAQIVDLGGPKTWALPYWNYEGPGDHNAIPVPFRNPTNGDGTVNVLYEAARAAGINSGAGLDPSVTTSTFAMSRPTYVGNSEFGGDVTATLAQFAANYGTLEVTPHNSVHGAVGGPDGLMANIDQAALDPIFWLHHCNIDRLWWIWQQTHQDPDPATYPTWGSQTFDFFDVSGAPASLASSGVQNIVNQLQYTYDHAILQITRPIPEPPWERPIEWPWPWPVASRPVASVHGGGDPELNSEIIGATEEPIRLVGQSITVPVEVDERAIAELRDSNVRHEGRVFLDFDDLEAERNPGVVYGVYVNLPESATRDERTAYQVGNLSFFGIDAALRPRGDEHPHSMHYSMEITPVLDRLHESGQWETGAIEVSLIPTPLIAPANRPDLVSRIQDTGHSESPVTIGRLSLHYS